MLLLCTNISSKMFNFVATDATVKCYNISCLTSTSVAANLDESLHVFIKNILLSLHSWKMSRLLVKITSVGVTNTAGKHQTFQWLKQTDASLTSWTECHTPSPTARHWTSTEQMRSPRLTPQELNWEEEFPLMNLQLGGDSTESEERLDPVTCSVTHLLSGCVSSSFIPRSGLIRVRRI